MNSKEIQFSKLSGAGNDFIMIDNREGILDGNINEWVQKVCRKGMSVGADGVILVEPSDKADFKMRYFNADGSEAETCGNGARCVARFAQLKGIAKPTMKFETLAGLYKAFVSKTGLVKVQMSEPGAPKYHIPLELSTGKYEGHFINTGVPHVVVMVDDLNKLDVFQVGREIRSHKEFAPAGTNVNFAKSIGPKTIRIRTYERGVEDETLACGTGSIASSIILFRLRKVMSPVTVQTQGGQQLIISFDSDEKKVYNVFLEGEARLVYEGSLTEEAFV